MNRLVLDTSAYSHFQTGHPEAVRLIDSAVWIGLPTVALGELETGFRLGRRHAANRDLLERFLESPVVESIAVDETVAQIYAEIVVDLRRNGTPLPTNDIWIAACAARTGATVLSFDSHFEAIARIGALVLSR